MIPSTRCARSFTHASEHSTRGFTGTLAALLFAVFVFGGIVSFLLIGLMVVVAGASVLAVLDWRRDGTAPDRLGS